MFQPQTQTRGEQTALIEEMVGNQKVVQAFCHEKEALGQFADVNDRLQKYSSRATFFSSLVNPSTRFVNSLVYAAVGITGALAVILTGGAFSVGNLSCFCLMQISIPSRLMRFRGCDRTAECSGMCGAFL